MIRTHAIWLGWCLYALVMAAHAQKMDPNQNRLQVQEVLKEVRSLRGHGQFEQALEKLMWLQEVSQPRQRVAFFRDGVGYLEWAKLAELYAPAQTRLQEKKERLLESFWSSKGDRTSSELCFEIVLIDRMTKRLPDTLDWFVTLDAKRPELARACFDHLTDVLLTSKHFKLMHKYEFDPMKHLSHLQFSHDLTISSLSSSQSKYRNKLIEQTQTKFVDTVLALINLALAWQDDSLAKAILAKAKCNNDDERFQSMSI